MDKASYVGELKLCICRQYEILMLTFEGTQIINL